MVFQLKKKTEPCFDELVISQEAQVVPAFILKVDKSSVEKILKKFDREIVEKKP